MLRHNLITLIAAVLLVPLTAAADPIPVELRQTEDGWQLLRGGEPYFIRGAGGDGSLEQLAAAGANSVRTWGAAGVGEILDEAHAQGLTVAVGIWLGHERHGFDYNDPSQVEAQLQAARETVLRYKDHPAVLLWGLGNEMEGFEAGDSPVIWKAVNDVAAMVKDLDPNHPTMTVTAELGGGRIKSLHEDSPAIDIHGVNSYGGAATVADRLAESGATKPYVITEFGPVGSWEMPKTEWGAPYEQTSTQKAEFYRQSYEKGVLGAPGRALGSYAFLWGQKMEGTETWFGMFLNDGSRLGAYDVMSEVWSGTPPENLAPTVEAVFIEGSVELEPGEELTATTAITDPDGDNPRVRWVLRPESGEYMTGGDFRQGLPDIEGAVLESDSKSARIRMPAEPGAYRLFVYAYDDVGSAATANVPLLVKGEVQPRMPSSVYDDGFENMPWAPSGWMGSTDFLTLDGSYADDVHEGSSAIRMRYEGKFGWVGVAWQNPPNNWGDMDGGYDLDGATHLELWARGEYGGEKASFGVGLLGSDAKFPDSGMTKVDGIVLTRDWRRYVVPLKKIDLSSVKTGFVVTLNGRSSPVTIYMDSIRFVR